MNLHKRAFNMVEVFITNIKSVCLSQEILKLLEKSFTTLKINFDLDDFNKPYPCGHSILRIEGKVIDPKSIIQYLKSKGIKCELFKDKICV